MARLMGQLYFLNAGKPPRGASLHGSKPEGKPPRGASLQGSKHEGNSERRPNEIFKLQSPYLIKDARSKIPEKSFLEIFQLQSSSPSVGK